MQAEKKYFTQAINGELYRVDTTGLKLVKERDFRNTEVKSVVSTKPRYPFSDIINGYL
jgi:hypothetical protein